VPFQKTFDGGGKGNGSLRLTNFYGGSKGPVVG